MDEPRYKLEVFEGPLDLLLSLISKNKVNICDIPITLILDQYLAYLEEMRSMDMEIAGEFILMASELMLIKSRMLLPKLPGAEEEDPRARLAEMLTEYKKTKEQAGQLAQLWRRYEGRIVKDPEVIEADVELLPHTGDMLSEAMLRIMRRFRDMGEIKTRPESALTNLLTETYHVPIPGRIFGIMRRLLREGDLSFMDIMAHASGRSERIALFIAVLELLRSQRVTIAEDNGGDNIILRLNRTHTRKDKHERTDIMAESWD